MKKNNPLFVKWYKPRGGCYLIIKSPEYALISRIWLMGHLSYHLCSAQLSFLNPLPLDNIEDKDAPLGGSVPSVSYPLYLITHPTFFI